MVSGATWIGCEYTKARRRNEPQHVSQFPRMPHNRRVESVVSSPTLAATSTSSAPKQPASPGIRVADNLPSSFPKAHWQKIWSTIPTTLEQGDQASG